MREAREAGIEVPTAEVEEDDSLGGFAYEMCYLHFRIRPEPHLVGEALDDFFEKEFKPRSERLTELLEPTHGDYLAYQAAVQIHREYQEFGTPEDGGRLHQPAWWLYIFDCVHAAEERARSLNDREQAFFDRQKADQAGQNSQAVPSGV